MLLAVLRALLTHMRADPTVRRVVARDPGGVCGSRRLLEKGGMRHCGLRLGEVDGAMVELVTYEAVAGSIDGGA